MFNEFEVYLDTQIVETKKAIQEAMGLGESDNVKVLKINENVYGIAKVYYNKAVRDGEAIDIKFLGSLDQLVNIWNESLIKAKEYDDFEKVIAEEAKIEIIEKIKKDYQIRISEGYDRK